MSLTRVDLPDPDTPVTDTKHPSGMRTSTPRRWCSRAPRMVSQPASGWRRAAGTGMVFLPDRYWPVSDLRDRSRPFTGPA